MGTKKLQTTMNLWSDNMSIQKEINTKDMVDVITGVLDHYMLLETLSVKELQCLCEDLKDTLDDFIGEEE